jgi:hypothetical protein
MHRVDVFVQQLNFAETIRLLESPVRQAFRHGSHLAEKSYLAGKATTFSPPGYAWEEISILKLRRKELHCEREGNSQMV